MVTTPVNIYFQTLKETIFTIISAIQISKLIKLSTILLLVCIERTVERCRTL